MPGLALTEVTESSPAPLIDLLIMRSAASEWYAILLRDGRLNPQGRSSLAAANQLALSPLCSHTERKGRHRKVVMKTVTPILRVAWYHFDGK